MAFVTGILGGGLAFLKWVFKYWKFALLAVVLVVVFNIAKDQLHRYGEAQFKAGVEATLTKMKTEVSKRDVVNRAIEKRAEDGLNGFSVEKQKQDKVRHAAEDLSQANIETIIKTVPMWNAEICSITPTVMAERNAIRALGPKAGDDK